MKIKEIRQVVTLLLTYKWKGEIRIDNLLLSLIEKNININDNDKEKYIDELCDPKTKYHDLFIKELSRVLSDNQDCNLIELNKKIDGIYILRKVDDDNELYEKTITIINSFEDYGQKKGTWFEDFCIEFFNDLGIKCEKTKVTNDKGIDIYGSYTTNINSILGKIIKNDDIYILGQAKYYTEKIDTPVIRKLVGDTMFIRFDELEYLDIKHNAIHLVVFSRNGFTEPAIKFAIKNKIELFDSNRIAHLIANNPSVNWNCLKIGN